MEVEESDRVSYIEALEKHHGYKIHNLELIRKVHLHKEPDEPKTLQLDLLFSAEYESGDHVGICPENSKKSVNFMLSRMTGIPPTKKPLSLTLVEECEFANAHDFPSGISLMEMLIHFVDLNSVPSQDVHEEWT